MRGNMTGGIILDTDRGAIGRREWQGLLVTGPERSAQWRRLRGFSLVIRAGNEVLGVAAVRSIGADLRVDELAVRGSGRDQETTDSIVDILETVALAGGHARVVVSSSSRTVRQVLRLLAYVPETSARRLCFVRRVAGLPEIRQIASGAQESHRQTRSQ